MRLPGRLRISWQDDTTLKVETDTGTQTRLLRFGGAPAPAEATWQGHSVAQWNTAARSLKVVTTNLRPGYVRKNGAPYSDRASSPSTGPERAAERRSVADGDHQGRGSADFTRPYTTSSDFKKLPDARVESHALLGAIVRAR